MKKLLVFVFKVVWAANFLAAQTAITVLDGETAKPLTGAYVVAQGKAENKAVASGFTNKEGEVLLNAIPPFSAIISFSGYKTEVIEVHSKNQAITLFYLSQNLDEFVVTASAVPTRVEDHVQKVKVINAERINSQGAMNLRDVLQNDLNIRITQDNILGSGIQMQGIGGENVKIMMNGVPIIGRLNGNVDLSQINMNQVEKIEIIEGPSSVNYGTNALGGVINIITKNKQQNTLTTNLNSYYETVGNYNFDGDLGIQKGRHLIQLNGGRYFFDGYSPVDSAGRFQTWRPKEQVFAGVNYGVGLGKLHFSYQAKAFREIIQSKGAPQSPFFVSAFDSYFTTYRFDNSVYLNGYLNKNHHVDLVASHNFYQRENRNLYKDLVTLNESPLDTNVEEFQLTMSRGTYNYVNKNSPVNVQAGYELNLDRANGIRIENGLQNMEDYAVFGKLDIGLFENKKLLIQPGARFIYNSAYDAPITPSLSLRFTPKENLIFRASYANGFRAPSLKELYFVFVDVNHNIFGNPDLRAESSNSINASLQLNQAINRANLQLNISGFYNQINDQIRSVATNISVDSVMYRNENIESFTSQGFRVEATANTTRLTTNIGYSYTGVLNDLGQDLLALNKFVYFPEYQVNFKYRLIEWGSSLNFFYKQFGDQPVLFTEYDDAVQAEVIKQGIISGYGMMDVSYNQPFFDGNLNVTLFAKNILNVANIQQTAGINTGAHTSAGNSLPVLWGRTFAISLKYNFKTKQ